MKMGRGLETVSEQEMSFMHECETLFLEAENYFQMRDQQKAVHMVKKDYTKINSRINTNLAAAKHNRLMPMRGSEELTQQQQEYNEENYGEDDIMMQPPN